ncbi:MAG: ATP-binding protein [Cyanobacteria bacterium P01_C01_bin.147]
MTDSTAMIYRADILAIDDTPENLQLLSQLLTRRQYKVRSVTKGTTALRAALAAPPDLILLDINMPGMSGYEVCERLKSEDITRNIPVIFISALGETLDKVRAFDVGGVDFVTKPFQVEEVIARIETHLQLRRLQQQLQAQNVRLQQEIRDRKQAQETFSKAFRASPSPIAITTLEGGQFIEVNPSFLKISGYTRHEVIGFRLDELNLGLDMEAYQRGRAQLANAGALHNWEFELRTKTGDWRTVLVSVENIELQGHQCALAIANDITERKRLENEFISLVSHELKTPMNSMIGALDLLGTGQLGSLTDKGQRMIDMAINNAERLVRLVNDVLDLERMKSGTLTLHPQVCNVPTLFQQAKTVMQPMAQDAQVNLVIEPVEVKLQVDGDRIQQLFTNLLSNAIKFSSPGDTVHLSAQVAESAVGDHPSSHPPTLSPPTSPLPHSPTSPSTLHITVCDQGRGIPPDKLTLIFDRFQQVDASDARAKGGTGLGLSICRQIVQQHQGRIWAESTLGEGSTFHITLPLTELDEDMPPQDAQGEH